MDAGMEMALITLTTNQFLPDSSSTIRKKVKEWLCTAIRKSMKVIGQTIRKMGMESITMLMEVSTKAVLRTEKEMGKGSSTMINARELKECGLMENWQVMDIWFLLILFMMAISKKELKMGKEKPL